MHIVYYMASHNNITAPNFQKPCSATPTSSPPHSPSSSPLSPSSSPKQSSAMSDDFNVNTTLKDITIVNFPATLKLTSTNYLAWKTQIEALLHGLDLYRYIDGTYPAPSPTIADDGKATPHPDYQKWFRQDRLLFGALVGSLSPQIVPLITNASSSLEAWKTLASTYASPSRGHIKQLQYRLKQITKTPNQTITDYMQNIKTVVDELAILGKKLDQEDLIDAVINGLDHSTYKPILDAIHARDSTISFNELHEKLINHELALAQQNSTTGIHQPAMVFYTHHQHKKPWPSRQENNVGLLPTPTKQVPQATGQRPFLGKCQWCHQKGHSLSNCFTFKKLNDPSWWCHQKGHSLSNCFTFKKLFPNASVPSPSNRFMQVKNAQAHLMNPTNPSSTTNWLFDSGASFHATNDLNNLSIHAPYDGTEELVIGDGSCLQISHIGSLILYTSNTPLILKNVLYVPSLSRNIISISRLCIDNNFLIEFYSFVFVIKDLATKLPLFTGTTIKGMYEIRSSPSPIIYTMHTATSSMWHHRLGHPQNKVFKQLSSFLSFNSSSIDNCNSCRINKSHRLPFHDSSLTSTQPLELIFSDVWCSPVESYDHYKYYIIFVDHFTKYTWLYPMKNKSESLTIFIRFQSLVENFFNTKIKQLFSDNGGEYLKLATYLASHGISHLTSPPHTPQHNGYAERRHRHIVETGLALLSHSNIPVTFWPFAFTTAAYLINRLPTSTLNNLSPFRCLFQKEPNYSKLRSFGCLCYPWLRPYSPHKLHSRSTPCVFVGYSPTQSAYYAYDPISTKVYTSRHVVFIEHEFPFNKLTTSSTPSATINLDHWVPLSIPITHAPTPSSPTSSQPDTPPSHPDTPPPQNTSPPTPPSPPPLIKMNTRTNPKPNKKCFNSNFQIYTASPTCPSEPSSISQALKHPSWRNAMQEEFDALERNCTWSLVPFSQAHNLIGSKWVFRIKYKPDGSIDRLKARLVAKGFNQRPGIDYRETFSPVLKPATLRLILSLAISQNWSLRQLDINNAFLQGHLHEDVFMSQPPGFVNPSFPNHVCKLHKALYGLRQASRAWYDELKTYLISLGFKPTISDSSLFILKTNSSFILVLVYVDDIIVTGVEVLPHPSGILLSQRKYILDILTRAKMSDCKPVSTSMTNTEPLLNRLSQFMHAPTSLHWIALKRLLRYLHGTLYHGIILRKNSSLTLHGFTDADWAGDKDNYRSTSGYIVYLGSNPISWSSKRQSTLARSSTEAEFRAVASTTTEVQWLTSLLTELGFSSSTTPTIYCDNLSATSYSANPVFHSRMKHLALDFHFVREKVQQGSLRVQHIAGDDQLADALTKPLPKSRFHYLISKIGLTSGSSILRGHIKI
ncbi:hypothetical protein OSB04_010987 [Centaurea solstitialis]|uniref:Integrase catalytic domain-containing protein n=1 Tax=Centaurea solstitialis TaxID=347529 RepID=A0AA38TTC4_9ASTR|nr:hypothetical protein OSB04_010987 [Centaurea solstitialis]